MFYNSGTTFGLLAIPVWPLVVAAGGEVVAVVGWHRMMVVVGGTVGQWRHGVLVVGMGRWWRGDGGQEGRGIVAEEGEAAAALHNSPGFSFGPLGR